MWRGGLLGIDGRPTNGITTSQLCHATTFRLPRNKPSQLENFLVQDQLGLPVTFCCVNLVGAHHIGQNVPTRTLRLQLVSEMLLATLAMADIPTGLVRR